MLSKIALAAAAAAAMLVPQTSQAAVNVAVAAPGGALAGYATPYVVAVTAAPFTFVNADPLAPHDFVSKATGPRTQPWCDPDLPCPLFWSEIIVAGESTPVLGLENAESGTTYEFYCTIHAATMQGTLVAV